MPKKKVLPRYTRFRMFPEQTNPDLGGGICGKKPAAKAFEGHCRQIRQAKSLFFNCFIN